MAEIKMTRLLKTAFTSLYLLSIVTVFVVFLPGTAKAAAEPGCYVQTFDGPSGSSSETALTECPNSLKNKPNQCFLVTNRSYGGGQFNEVECSKINVTPGAVPPSTVVNQNISNQDPRNNIEVDCAESIDSDHCNITKHLVTFINFLSAAAMLAITASIMIAGYQYMTARDKAESIQAAKTRIVWALVALVLFIFGYALLNFFVPGGVL